MEGGDACNANMYGKIDIPILMEQPTDSSGIPEKPGHVRRLVKSIYELKQAGRIGGYLLARALVTWGFFQCKFDHRLLFKQEGDEYAMIIIVLDDMSFVSPRMLDTLKPKLQSTFGVNLFKKVRSFIGWKIS